MSQDKSSSRSSNGPTSNSGFLFERSPVFERSPRLADLLSTEIVGQYPCRQPNQSMHRTLQTLTSTELFSGKIDDASAAQCVLSGLWMVHGFLDQSHEICQSIPTAEGSFWHAIMHRLEGDYWNSKYWYRQIVRHTVIERIGARLQAKWTPSDFVDQCERLQKTTLESPDQVTARRVAQVEWQELFLYCWEQANGGQPFPAHDETKSPRTGNL